MQLSACSATGGHSAICFTTVYPSAAAVHCGPASTLRLSGTPIHQIAAGSSSGSGTTTPALFGIGTFRVDDQITVLPFPPSVRQPMPVLLGSGGRLGGTMQIVRTGPPNSAFVLAHGAPGNPFLIGAGIDPVWLDPTSITIQATGVGSHQIQQAIPNAPVLRGLLTAWQVLDITATGALQLSNPSTVVLH